MTVEMGPRDVDLGLRERFAGQFIRFWAWAVGVVSDDVDLRFRVPTATLILSGESEHSGDEYERGSLAATLISVNEMAMMAVMAYSGIGTMSLTAAPSVAIAFLLLIAACVAGVSLVGSASLTTSINVIDHTTEPAPDAVDELKERYVAGEIDDAELEREAAEVWER
jgi:uncharacterized membrane protein